MATILNIIRLTLVLLIIPLAGFTQSVPTEYSKISFGSYSFRTSKLKEYTINSYRELLYTERVDKKLSILGKLNKSEHKKLFKTLSEGNFNTIHLDEHIRDYNFIELTDSNNKKYKLIWSQTPPKEVAELYEYLNSIVASIVTSGAEVVQE